MEVCRVCGSDNKILIPISENGDRQIDKEINACLPTKVTTKEASSVKICHTCASKLQICYDLFSVFKRTDVKRRQWNAKNNVCYICMTNKGILESLTEQDQYVQYITTDLSSQVKISRKSLNNICHNCAYKLDELHSLREVVSSRESKKSGGRPSSARKNIMDSPLVASPKRRSLNFCDISRTQNTPRKSRIIKSMEILEYCAKCRTEIKSYNKNSCSCRKQKILPSTIKLIDCQKFTEDSRKPKKSPGRPRKSPGDILTRKRHRSPSVEIITTKRRRLTDEFNKNDELQNNRPVRTKRTSVFETSFESQKSMSNNTRKSSRKSDIQTSVTTDLPEKRVRRRTTNFEFPSENKHIKSETIIKQRSARAVTKKDHTEGRIPHVVLKIKSSRSGRPRKSTEVEPNKSSGNKKLPLPEKSKDKRKPKIEDKRGRSRTQASRISNKEEKSRPERNSIKGRKRITPFTCTECSKVYPSTVEGKIHMLSHTSAAVPVLKLVHCRPPTEEEKITDDTIDLISSDEEDLTEESESRRIAKGLLIDVIEKIVNDRVPLDIDNTEDKTSVADVEVNRTGDSLEEIENISCDYNLESIEDNEMLNDDNETINELENGSFEKETPASKDDSIEEIVTEDSKDDHNSSHDDNTVDDTASKQTDNGDHDSYNSKNVDHQTHNVDDNVDYDDNMEENVNDNNTMEDNVDSHNMEDNVDDGHHDISHNMEDNVDDDHDISHNMEDNVDDGHHEISLNMEDNVDDDHDISHNMEDNVDDDHHDISHNMEDNVDDEHHDVSHNMEDNVDDHQDIEEDDHVSHDVGDDVDNEIYHVKDNLDNDNQNMEAYESHNMENNGYDINSIEDNIIESKTDSSGDLHSTTTSSQEEIKSDDVATECCNTVEDCSNDESSPQSFHNQNSEINAPVDSSWHNAEDANVSDNSSVCSVAEVDDLDACNKSESGTEERFDNEVSPCEINIQSESVNGECDEVVGENSSDTDNEDYEEQNCSEKITRPEEDINSHFITGVEKSSISIKPNTINETSYHPPAFSDDYSPIHSDEDFND